MARLIPSILRATDLPLAVLSAARLDGVLWGIHDAYCPVDEPDRPELRTRALAAVVHQQDIIVGRTAAWVHGASTRVLGAVEVCARARPLDSWRTGMRYREIAIDDADLVQFSPDGPRVTTRARTIGDIAVDSWRQAYDADLILGLCDGDSAVVRRYANELAATCRRPGKTAGIELLADVAASAEKCTAQQSESSSISRR